MFIQQVIAHTPVWVWIMLAYLVWQGVRALQDQTVSLRRMVVVPVLFAAWGIEGMLSGHPGPMQWLCWIAGAVVLAPLGLLTGPTLHAVDPATGLVHRGGSAGPLIRSLSVFVLKYGSAVAVAMQTPPSPTTLAVSAAISGATAGYFGGWLLSLRVRHKVAPRSALQAA
ncbi:hypothetical protein NFI95_13085 [Acetobacteraceae bacterium KSS8]|uniref:Transmembrane protein n=1 Tax=Endosaccharibacter trunci TaxID=2812733 RepID=A0ABT1W906_9PROT|nr:hypothetical protein [Acetobacteraceae bacterium KSS8]